MHARPAVLLFCVVVGLGACRRHAQVADRTQQTASVTRMQRFQRMRAAAGEAPAPREERVGATAAPPPGPQGPGFISTMSSAVPDARGGPGPASLGTQGRLPPELTDPKSLARQSARARMMAAQDPAEFCRRRLLENRPLGGGCKTLLGRQGAGG